MGAAAAPAGSLAGFQPGLTGFGNGGVAGRGGSSAGGGDVGAGPAPSVPGLPAAFPCSLPGGSRQDSEGREKGGAGRTDPLGKGEVCSLVKGLLL